MFTAHQRLPFPIPKGHALTRDGRIAPKLKRPMPKLKGR
jgi:hypothetical protein